MKKINSNLLKIQPLEVLDGNRIVNCTGAGDTLLGVSAWGHIYGNLSLENAVMLGMEGAKQSLMSETPVSENLGEKLLGGNRAKL